MEKIIFHIRTSVILGSSIPHHNSNVEPLAYDDITDVYFDREGRMTSEESGSGTTRYTYGPNGESVRKTLQFSEINDAGATIEHMRQWNYEYDEDGFLLHISYHDAVQPPQYWIFMDKGGIPSDSSSDEWYDWSLDGKTCFVSIRSSEEGHTSRSYRVERYNEDGLLFEEIWYDCDHIRTSRKTYFYWKGGNKQRTLFTYKTEPLNVLAEPSRIVETDDYDEKGRWIARYTNGKLEMRIEYDEDEEGNGIEARFFIPDGTLIALMKRQIDYREV